MKDVGLGAVLAPLQDVNGDGIDDLLCGLPNSSPGGIVSAGQVLILSGKDGTRLRSIEGKVPRGRLGMSVASCADVDGDKRCDFAVSSCVPSEGGRPAKGQVLVYSGRSGDLICVLSGEPNGDGFGNPIAGMGDVDGDNIGDIAIGVPYANYKGPGGIQPPKASTDIPTEVGGEVRVYSGKTRECLYVIRGGRHEDWTSLSLLAIPDADADGAPDLIVAAPFGRVVSVFSGRRGGIIKTLPKASDGVFPGFGMSVAPLLGARGSWNWSQSEVRSATASAATKGRVVVYAGLEDKPLLSVEDPCGMDGASATFGWAVCIVGDVNADGVIDIAVGDRCCENKGAELAGRVYVFSGKDGTILYAVNGSKGDMLGESILTTGDVNGDGVRDFVVGAPWANRGTTCAAGQVKAISGRNGNVLWSIDGNR